MRRHLICLAIVLIALPLFSQVAPSDQLEVGPPPLRRAEPPATTASAEDLEKRGDELRVQKDYLDALDYYRAALQRKPSNIATLYNKIGISELLSQHFKEARKNFERAIKNDRQYADAYNNLGVTHYLAKKYGKAIKQYQKAIALRQDSGSYFSNLGAAYFSRKDFARASIAYGQALQLDPDIFERTARAGVAAQMSSPEDRAHFDYVLAKLFARMGHSERCLQYLRRAMEDGYKDIENVYKDSEFSDLRKDPRFSELMSARPPAIPE